MPNRIWIDKTTATWGDTRDLVIVDVESEYQMEWISEASDADRIHYAKTAGIPIVFESDDD